MKNTWSKWDIEEEKGYELFSVDFGEYHLRLHHWLSKNRWTVNIVGHDLARKDIDGDLSLEAAKAESVKFFQEWVDIQVVRLTAAWAASKTVSSS